MRSCHLSSSMPCNYSPFIFEQNPTSSQWSRGPHTVKPLFPLWFSLLLPLTHCSLVTRSTGVPSTWNGRPPDVNIHSSLPASLRSILGDALPRATLFEIAPPSASSSNLPYPAPLSFFYSVYHFPFYLLKTLIIYSFVYLLPLEKKFHEGRSVNVSFTDISQVLRIVSGT